MIEPFDDYELYFLDRYLIGGENSVRGFRYRRIWARNVDGESILDEFGSPQGGDQFAQLNLEYHFLVGGPFRIVLFGDGGAVYGAGFCDPAQINCEEPEFPDGLRYSAGAEMRIFVPVFGAPLRFIYSKNLDPLPGDESVFESFQFSIGTSF
jgi:outer membrane protein assembly factor BamA